MNSQQCLRFFVELDVAVEDEEAVRAAARDSVTRSDHASESQLSAELAAVEEDLPHAVAYLLDPLAAVPTGQGVRGVSATIRYTASGP